MALFYASLNSGSNGNCYYVGNESEAVLIDAGISCKETEKRLKSLELTVGKIKAIFISHEHIDHIKGAEMFCRRHSVPVYITEKTLKRSRINLPEELIVLMNTDVPNTIGQMKISAFAKLHDAVDPHSFTVEYLNKIIGIFTDIGKPCENVKSHFSRCDVAFLESNYDEEMLKNGGYPYHLKKRISGDEGHLSNTQALELFLDHGSSSMPHLILSHLSRENNKPDIVKDLFTRNAKETLITVASRYEHSKLFFLGDMKIKKVAPPRTMQLDLFDC